jgi:hypothetical protein
MKKLLSLIAAIFMVATTFAQDEVTLTVIGTGENEEKATLQALRSAIEQTFGAFVSANTTILNDKLVQDEIVSVSTGNVKKYEKKAVATLPNGHVSVSLNATIAINKLISYAQSKGSKAEFAGSTYAMNIKLLRLKIQSTRKAFELMIQNLEHIAKDMFSAELNMSNSPKLNKVKHLGEIYYFDCYVRFHSNIASDNFYKMFYSTIHELKLNMHDIKLCLENNIELYQINDYPKTFGIHDFNYIAQRTDEDKFFAREEVDPIVLPMSSKEYIEYGNRISKAITSALLRYKIQEIGNPQNTYYYRQCLDKEGCKPISLNNEFERNFKNGQWFVYSDKWNVAIHHYNYMISYNSLPLLLRQLNDGTPKMLNCFTERYILIKDIKKEKIVLTKEEQKLLKRKKYTGPFYKITTSYQPQLITIHQVKVAIDPESIDKFQGFELVGISDSQIPPTIIKE